MVLVRTWNPGQNPGKRLKFEILDQDFNFKHYSGGENMITVYKVLDLKIYIKFKKNQKILIISK